MQLQRVSSRKKPRETSQKRILEISIGLFAKFGFAGVSMRQIAAAVGVSMPTIYHFYENKEILYRAVEAELYGAHSHQLISALREEGTPRQRFRNFMRAIMGMLLENSDYHSIVTRSLIEQDAGNLAFLVENSLKGVIGELRDVLKDCDRETTDDVDLVFIFGSILGFVTMLPVKPLLGTALSGSDIRDRQIEQVVDLVVRSVLPLNG